MDIPQISDDESRWQALLRRDPAADGQFVYSVRTTGIYCRPTCAARLALRQNVRFHATCESAERAGFRPCRRCRPTEASRTTQQSVAVAQVCRIISQADQVPSLSELASSVGLSSSHLHRVFKAQTGLTPGAYARAHRTRRVRQELASRATITEAIYEAGYNTASRFYESAHGVLGMTPGAFRAGGDGVHIRFAVGECWLGSILVAATDRGVCAILLGDDPIALAHDLEVRFPHAQIIEGDADFEQLVARVVGQVERPSLGVDLPLDIRGTAFQQRVWEALRQIPPGSTASYTEIARQIGQPQSVRAVAQACGANALAVAIPCHRVVRSDGSLSGYRWGIERKAKLLRREGGGT